MNDIFKTLMLIAILITPSIAFSQQLEPILETKVTAVGVFSLGSAQGDVMLEVEPTTTTCSSGYFIEDDAVMQGEIYSLLLSAFHADSTVKLRAWSGVNWSGSSQTTWCKLQSVSVAKD